MERYEIKKGGLVEIKLETARLLSEKETTDFLKNLSLPPEKVILTQTENPKLIAGAVATIADTKIDGSIKGALLNIHRALAG